MPSLCPTLPSREPILSFVDELGDPRLGEAADLPGDLDWINPGEAAHAELLSGDADRPDQPLVAYVPEGVGVDHRLDPGDGLVGGDQLLPRRHVDPHVAGGDDRGASDPDVDLLRPRRPHHVDDPPAGGAADDAVVDHDDALPLDVRADGVHLQPHGDLPQLLAGHDEGPPDVPVLHQTLPVLDVRPLVVADGEGDPGVGDRGHRIRLQGVLLGEDRADPHPNVVDEPPVHDAVGAGEVDVLKDAVGGALLVR